LLRSWELSYGPAEVKGTSSAGSSNDARARQVDGKPPGALNEPSSEMGSCGWRVFSHFLLSRDGESVPDVAADF